MKAFHSTAKISRLWRPLAVGFAMLLLSACQQEEGSMVSVAENDVLQVLKDPSCGCCELWIDHMNSNGFVSRISHPQNLSERKLELGIQPRYQSCHTAISDNGYVFEGHVPARLVQQFLEEAPADAIGLAVPGMPLGSPGMELNDQFHPYDVMMLMKDGSAQVYASIETQDQQY